MLLGGATMLLVACTAGNGTANLNTKTYTTISAGDKHTCALDGSQQVWCWGENTYGQLGDGTIVSKNVPAPLATISGAQNRFLQISAGGVHTCAIATDTTVWCWGANFVGKLGDGTRKSSNIPVKVIGLPVGVTAVATGADHSCAVTDIGALWCWGANNAHQLGDPQQTEQFDQANLVPSQIFDREVTQYISRGATSCAIRGAVWCTGRNWRKTDGITRSWTQLDTAESTSIALGRTHACGLIGTQVSCWGIGVYGQIGPSSPQNPWQWTEPVVIEDITATTVVASEATTCALTTDGEVTCWGLRPPGRVTIWYETQNFASSKQPWVVNGFTNSATSITAGAAHFCALDSSGHAYCWGSNEHGELGNSTNSDTAEAVRVSGPN